MRVEVYYNLHKNLFSVRHKGRVINHFFNVTLENVTFAVQSAGNKKARLTGHKNVHAFVRGDMVTVGDTEGTAVTYDPHKYTTFVDKETKAPRFKAKRVTLRKPAFRGPSIIAMD
tara:strand:+ start:3707 stop:4051 length:345 start_codon:yes stop_codon:yes gene_type:complete